MIICLESSLLGGYLTNEVPGLITGVLHLAGKSQPVRVELAGNFLRDIAGCRVDFHNPLPEANQAEVVRRLDEAVAREAAARFEEAKAKDEVQTLTIYIKGQVCADARHTIPDPRRWGYRHCVHCVALGSDSFPPASLAPSPENGNPHQMPSVPTVSLKQAEVHALWRASSLTLNKGFTKRLVF